MTWRGALGVTLLLSACGDGSAGKASSPIPGSTCGDSVVEGLESCELGEIGCNDDCQPCERRFQVSKV